MPSPFPGMDPYLEQAHVWSSVHNNLITYMGEALNESLPESFVATTEERVQIVLPRRDIRPDVTIHQVTVDGDSGGVAIATLPEVVTDSPLVFDIEPFEERQSYIEIRLVGGPDEGRLVTAIELLSHSNKSPYGEGRAAYIQKQDRLLLSDAHFLEIDLLRAGLHTVAVPEDLLLERRPRQDYRICLHRADVRWRYLVWAWTVRDPVPVIPVPLTPDSSPVALDLQAILTRCYDAWRYARRLHYDRAVEPPLSDADARWADELLRERGLR